MKQKGNLLKAGVATILALVVISIFALGVNGAGAQQAGIEKRDLFLLAAPSQVDSNGEVLEYKGADRITQTSPKIKFKVWKTGETLEYSLTPTGEATIKLSGKRFKVRMIKPNQRDSPILVDIDGDGTIEQNPSVKDLFYKTKSVKGTGFTCNKVATLDDGTGKYLYTRQGQVKLSLIKITPNKVAVKVNGQPSSWIENGESEYINGLNVQPINILYQNYAGGVKQATFCLN